MCIKNGKYKECIICGCEFYITPAQESRGRYLCCSKECGYKYRSTLVNTKKGKTYNHLQRAVTRKCKTCGIEFKAINDHNGKLGGKNTRKKHKLFFVNSDGLYLILHTYSSQKIVKMVKILNKVENNLIVK